MFINFVTIKDSYSCHLSTRAFVEAEDTLKSNPINVMMSIGEGELPKLKDLLVILYCSMKQFNHGIKFEDMYGIFDDYVANGGTLGSLTDFVTELFDDGGYFGKSEDKKAEAEDTSKN